MPEYTSRAEMTRAAKRLGHRVRAKPPGDPYNAACTKCGAVVYYGVKSADPRKRKPKIFGSVALITPCSAH